VRYPVVLFDLDGTVVDSGPIILASMRHATQTVLGRDYTDAELLAHVGGPGLEAQMAAIEPGQTDELVRVYREHNEPLHDTLAGFEGIETTLETLLARGHRLGIVTAKRRSTVDLAFDRLPLAHLFEVVVGGDETERHKPDPEPLLFALTRLEAPSADAAYVGDSPYDMQSARAAGLFAVGVTWGGIHDRSVLGSADVIVDSAKELLDVL